MSGIIILAMDSWPGSFWALGGTYYYHFIERTLFFQKSQLVQVQRIDVYTVLSQKWHIYITEMRSGRTGTKQFCSRLDDEITSSHRIKDLKPVNIPSWAWKWLMNPYP